MSVQTACADCTQAQALSARHGVKLPRCRVHSLEPKHTEQREGSTMDGMWGRWARRRRLTGLGCLTGTAVAIAAAVLCFTLNLAPFVGVLIAAAAVLTVHAGFEFWDAHTHSKEARQWPI